MAWPGIGEPDTGALVYCGAVTSSQTESGGLDISDFYRIPKLAGMKMSATIKSSFNHHETEVQTNGAPKQLQVGTKPSGFGSAINGGEMLLLSLATCFCNDIYREAAKRNMEVTSVEVEVSGEFGAEGEPGFNFSYRTRVTSDAPASEIDELTTHTDRVAEIHNTLRKGLNIILTK